MRQMLAFVVALLLLPAASGAAINLSQDDVHLLDLPILVAECNRDPGRDLQPGGGRFDRLMTLLGAKTHIPAVGFALWLDRIEQAVSRTGEVAR